MEELKHLMLMWDSLHVGGCLLLLVAPYSISTLCILLGVLWKKEFSIARNVCVFMVWWYMVTIRFGTPMGIISTLFFRHSKRRKQMLSSVSARERTDPVHSTAAWLFPLLLRANGLSVTFLIRFVFASKSNISESIVSLQPPITRT